MAGEVEEQLRRGSLLLDAMLSDCSKCSSSGVVTNRLVGCRSLSKESVFLAMMT